MNQELSTLKIATGSINYTAIAFSALRYLPPELQDTLRSCGQWVDILQSCRESAWESYQNGDSLKEAGNRANRAIYGAMKALGWRRKSTRRDKTGRYIANYAMTVGDVRSRGSRSPLPEEALVFSEEGQERNEMLRDFAPIFFSILHESEKQNNHKSAEQAMQDALEMANIMLLEMQNHEVPAIALELQLSENQVQYRVNKARKIINAHMSKEGKDDSD